MSVVFRIVGGDRIWVEKKIHGCGEGVSGVFNVVYRELYMTERGHLKEGETQDVTKKQDSREGKKHRKHSARQYTGYNLGILRLYVAG